MKKNLLLLLCVWLCLLSVACTNSRNKEKDRSEINNAITSPLKDLNLIQEKIPDNLLSARVNTYVIKADLTCGQLQQEIDGLDKVLAPDIDQPKKEKASHLERGADALGDASISAIKRTTESVIPYRSWVRKLTGAERASKLVADAIQAGNLRRAFLKGYKVKTCS